jgi:hypothetical protein
MYLFWTGCLSKVNFENVITFDSFQDNEKHDKRMLCVKHQWLSGKVSEACSLEAVSAVGLSKFKIFYQFFWGGRIFSNRLKQPLPRRSWFPSHRAWDMNLFSTQSAIALAFSSGLCISPKRPWIAVDAFGLCGIAVTIDPMIKPIFITRLI